MISILLVSMPRSQAADVIATGAASRDAKTEPSIVALGHLGFNKVSDSELAAPVTLAERDRFGFRRVLTPRSSAAAGGSVALVSESSRSAKSILTLQQKATGEDQVLLTVDPPTIDFGTVQLGSEENEMGTLIASDSDVTVYYATIDSPEFTISGLSFPFTIPAGQRQSYTVTFRPQAVGTVSSTLSFFSNAGTSLTTQGLTGIGGDHSVALSWNASTSQDVIGYNVYRGTTSGGPYSKINSGLDANTVYTDASVSDGATYYYVTTAVNSSGQESVNSNEVQAIIP